MNQPNIYPFRYICQIKSPRREIINEIPRRHSLARDNLKAPCGAFKLHHLDFDIYAGWKIQRREALDNRWGWVQDVDETLVNP